VVLPIFSNPATTTRSPVREMPLDTLARMLI
jgi:hypothetical protein